MPKYVKHTLAPVYDENARILILGTMPSPKSREAGFYYSHPQNRFWPVLAKVFKEEIPKSTQEKLSFLLSHHIALWDVLQSCTIDGADDSSIREPIANDIGLILQKAPIQTIYTTGGKSTALYKKLCLPRTNRKSVLLPSTSPANCRHYTFERLVEAYQIILSVLL